MGNSNFKNRRSESKDIEKIVLGLIEEGEKFIKIENYELASYSFKEALKIAKKPEDIDLIKEKIAFSQKHMRSKGS